ncbi:hypothetical protein PoB_000782800 [Plakobranchus ocellatus]|uniref:Uncharacterized protein n=1 Tax=Plakobranchus ocellatus TaxID=259542 RepID=A0AAV3YGQ6_9GAST|nr:hypothetical protein PoB_000782800 [Plakobranchus ocellatus]
MEETEKAATESKNKKRALPQKAAIKAKQPAKHPEPEPSTCNSQNVAETPESKSSNYSDPEWTPAQESRCNIFDSFA